MPTKTFFNLPEAKRERVMEAIRAEFARCTIEDVSINKIISAAGIPRGSFYQYFENKQDMLNFLLSDYRRIVISQARESLIENNGDLFTMFLDIYDFTCSFVFETSDNITFENLFSDIRIYMDFYNSYIAQYQTDSLSKELISHINIDLLKINTPAELKNLIDILIVILSEALAHTFYNSSSNLPDNVRNEYIAKLELIRYGFQKN